MNEYTPPDSRWLKGSEYGGVADTIAGGIQPKSVDNLTTGEKLRLSYMTGVESTDPQLSIDDRRQMLGLRPADGVRPQWLDNVSDDPKLESEARREGFGNE